MKLRAKMAGASTVFVDGDTEEVLLSFSWDSNGRVSLAYHIYNEQGELVADSGGSYPAEPVCIESMGEILLEVPSDLDRHINYKLYNKAGALLTVSVEGRTSIYGLLRMETHKKAAFPPKK